VDAHAVRHLPIGRLNPPVCLISYKHALSGTVIDSVSSKINSMKKHLILVAFMMAGVVVFAQEKGRGYRGDDMTARRDDRHAHNHRVAADRGARIKRELSLSERQYDRFQEVDKSYRQQLSHMKHTSRHEGGRRAEFMKLRKDYDKSMKSILSKKQYHKWSEMKKSPHHHRGDTRRKHNDGHAR
jgi:hypothetical protein